MAPATKRNYPRCLDIWILAALRQERETENRELYEKAAQLELEREYHSAMQAWEKCHFRRQFKLRQPHSCESIATPKRDLKKYLGHHAITLRGGMLFFLFWGWFRDVIIFRVGKFVAVFFFFFLFAYFIRDETKRFVSSQSFFVYLADFFHVSIPIVFLCL